MANVAVRWLSGHLLRQRAPTFLTVLLIAGLAEIGAAVGMAYVAGFTAVNDVGGFSWRWVGAILAGLASSFAGYYVGYRGVYEIADGPRLPSAELAAVVIGSFGGFLAHGGSALDRYALRAAGADERESKVRASLLTGMEQGVLAVIATAAAIAVLTQGLAKPTNDFSVPWAVIPIPGFAVAFWVADRYRTRLRGGTGWRGVLSIFLDSIQLNRELFLKPHHQGPAVFGIALFWIGDAFAMWAALCAFGFHMNAAALFIGYATGMLFTRRTAPLGGCGILMAVLPATLWYSGAPFAVAVVAVFTYRVATFWLPVPFALAARPTLVDMGRRKREAVR
jgi:glycosyltransferase 2 family protein